MPINVLIVSEDTSVAARIAELILSDTYAVTACAPGALPANQPDLFVIALPNLQSPEEQVIESLRSDDATAALPIVIVSKLPMIALQSVPYASDWTIGIVEEPVQRQVLLDTMRFLLNPDS
ncbi:MAG: hypothetical protein HC876_11520 [Chloroflexaceae bacterium]|nr:hypothetical protein [Chloroflexaceae bacterium]NJO06091.1 hypothetical protein [Chloroflexaceae bacterium]